MINHYPVNIQEQPFLEGNTVSFSHKYIDSTECSCGNDITLDGFIEFSQTGKVTYIVKNKQNPDKEILGDDITFLACGKCGSIYKYPAVDEDYRVKTYDKYSYGVLNLQHPLFLKALTIRDI